jgi:uncharacterized membrane protein
MAREVQGCASDRLALGLGWLSIGLGLAELSAPRTMARLIGLRQSGETAAVMRAFGAREVANGFAILGQPANAKWIWSRVGGDILDLSTLGTALGSSATDRGRITAAAAAVFGVTVLDVFTAGRLSRSRTHNGARRGALRVEEVTTINRPIEDVYRFWRNFENFPRFMRHLESVEVIDDRQSRWRAIGPAGTRVEWAADIVQDVPYSWISWRSIRGDVPNSGSVRFQRAPGARGTEVRVQLQYSPPGGRLGRSLAWLFGESPEQQIHEDLRRVKQLLEAGEVAVSDGIGLRQPARPAPTREEMLDRAGVSA